MPSLKTILLIIACVFVLYTLAVVVKYMFMLRRGRQAGAAIGLGDLIAMRMRKVDPGTVVDAYLTARNAGVDVNINDVERHQSHGGRVENVIEALRLAATRQLRVTWRDLCQQDLNGDNVVELIRNRLKAAEQSRQRSSDAGKK